MKRRARAIVRARARHFAFLRRRRAFAAAARSLRANIADIPKYTAPAAANAHAAAAVSAVFDTGHPAASVSAPYIAGAACHAHAATAAAGATELRLAVPAGATARFVYEPGANDTGAAILGSLVNASGMTIIFK